jgi:FkbH-like protein
MNKPGRVSKIPKIYLSGDLTVSAIARHLGLLSANMNSKLAIVEPRFNTWFQDIVDRRSPVYSENPDYTLILLSPRVLTDLPDLERTFDTFLGELTQWQGDGQFLVTNLCVDPLSVPTWLTEGQQLWQLCENINRKLHEHSQRLPWLHVIDLKGFFVRHGAARLHDPRYEMTGRLYYHPNASKLFAELVLRHLRALTVSPKKLLAVDLDNTLWGGILGEDGMGGLRLGGENEGYAFVRFQRALKTLKKNGVLLAVVSKNNEEDALEIIRNHPDMVLKLEDFVTYRINWDPKPRNLLSIAEELGLGIDSFVFFDDSDFEREMMRETIPEVDVIDVPEDPALYVRAISDYAGFDSLHITPEDQSRTEMYHTEFARNRLQKSAASREEFFLSLQMKAFIQKVDLNGLDRVHQLINKTNQFNLTTKRYTRSQLQELLNHERFELLAVRLQDSLGESGTIGVMIVKKKPPEWRLDSFLLSCRVIGRTLEFALIRWLAEKAKDDGIPHLVAEFVPTKRNAVAKDFLPAAGFRELDKGTWLLNLEEHPKIPEDYVNVSVS